MYAERITNTKAHITIANKRVDMRRGKISSSAWVNEPLTNQTLFTILNILSFGWFLMM